MPRNFDSEIAAKNAELVALKRGMEVTATELISACGRFLAEWYPQHARREVEYDAEVTHKLPSGSLQELKAEVNSLVDRAPEIAASLLDRNSVWWHRDTSLVNKPNSVGDLYWMYDKQLPEILSDPIRYAMGAVATPLEKRGYLKADAGLLHRRWRYSADAYRTETPPYYPQSRPDLPDELVKLAAKYSEDHKAAKDLLRVIDSLAREKRQAEAGSLWDSA